MRRSRRAAAPADPYERTKAAVEALCPDKRQDEFDEALLAELKALVKADEVRGGVGGWSEAGRFCTYTATLFCCRFEA